MEKRKRLYLLLEEYGYNRKLHSPLRRQRQMSISDRCSQQDFHFDYVFVDNPQLSTRANFFPVFHTLFRAHETEADLVCRLLLEKKKSSYTLSIIRISDSTRTLFLSCDTFSSNFRPLHTLYHTHITTC